MFLLLDMPPEKFNNMPPEKYNNIVRERKDFANGKANLKPKAAVTATAAPTENPKSELLFCFPFRCVGCLP